MSDADTSAEAVEALAAPLASLPFNMAVADFDRAAATLRALMAERDTARRNEQIARGWEHQAQKNEAAEIAARNEAESRLEAALAEVARLREALERMVYETTHLSPEEDDGLHWCCISKDALAKARAALAKGAPHG